MSFFQELKRRNVFRVGVAYLLAGWVLLQAIDFVLDAISAPNWILQVFILAVIAGFLVVIVFSWVFEVTPEGIKREKDIDRTKSIAPQTGRRLDRVIIAFMALAIVFLVVDRYVSMDRTDAVEDRSAAESRAERAPTDSEEASVGGREAAEPLAPKEKSVAVLPFLALSSGPDDGYFADGLTDEILNSLAQLPELLVTSRTSSFHFKGQDVPLQDIAEQLGVGNIVEGSVRRSGDRLRVTAQLIRASDGFHLWSENYDSTSADTIAVQEDIAEKIAIAMKVVLDENRREAMRRSGLRNVEAFIAMQKGLEVFENAHGDEDMIGKLRQSNVYFEKVQELVPGYPKSYQAHSDLYVHLLGFGASGMEDGASSPAELEEAIAGARADGEAVIRYAVTPEERNNAELDLAFIGGDWRGMTARIEQFSREQGCNESLWADNLMLPFGYAQQALVRIEEFSICDPMSSGTWRSLVRAHLWAGNFETAVNIARQGTELAPGEWLSLLLIMAEVADGQFEQAEADVANRLQFEVDRRTGRFLVAAAQGDRVAIKKLQMQEAQDPRADDLWALVYTGWNGDREAANEIAGRIDQHVYGSQTLATTLLWCLCGGPWDLSATPNFAADLQQSGLTWPPQSPIRFPMQEW